MPVPAGTELLSASYVTSVGVKKPGTSTVGSGRCEYEGMNSAPDAVDGRADGDATRAIEAFLTECARALVEVAGVDPERRSRAERGAAERGAVERGAGVFSAALARSKPTPERYEPSWLTVLETVDQLDDEPLARLFASVAPLLPWVPSPRSDDGGTTMALALLDTTRDFGSVRVGLMYLAPETQYPLHSHPPQELYLTVAGTARWRHGGHDDLRSIGPRRPVYNNPDDLHTAIADDGPVVALYVLWDDDPVDT